MAFSRKPPPPTTAEDFIAAADALPAAPSAAPAPAAQEAPARTPVQARRKSPRTERSKPWEEFNRKAPPKNVFNLRLNDYYLAILRHLAAQDEDTSMQRICTKILLPELERRVSGKPV